MKEFELNKMKEFELNKMKEFELNKMKEFELNKMKEFEFTEKSIYNIIIFVYLLIGVLYVIFDKNITSGNYISLIVFFTFKMLTNYRKCTFSYLECKIRKVKKEEGYLYDIMDHIVNLRNNKYKMVLYMLSLLLIMHFSPIKKILKL